MLPIEIQMQIDLMAADARSEIAKGFAALRERLLPETVSDPGLARWLAQKRVHVHPLWDMSRREIRDAHVSALCMGIVLPWIAAR